MTLKTWLTSWHTGVRNLCSAAFTIFLLFHKRHLLSGSAIAFSFSLCAVLVWTVMLMCVQDRLLQTDRLWPGGDLNLRAERLSSSPQRASSFYGSDINYTIHSFACVLKWHEIIRSLTLMFLPQGGSHIIITEGTVSMLDLRWSLSGVYTAVPRSLFFIFFNSFHWWWDFLKRQTLAYNKHFFGNYEHTLTVFYDIRWELRNTNTSTGLQHIHVSVCFVLMI